jgi:hypothetical protein
MDYEPWFAFFRRFDNLTDSFQRRNLDDGFTLRALDPILNMFGEAKASFYLVGEVALDLRASSSWLKQFNIRGFRAPMIGIRESAYKLFHEHGLTYSSSIYLCAGGCFISIRDKSKFLKTLLRHFPVSPFGVYLDEILRAKAV